MRLGLFQLGWAEAASPRCKFDIIVNYLIGLAPALAATKSNWQITMNSGFVKFQSKNFKDTFCYILLVDKTLKQ